MQKLTFFLFATFSFLAPSSHAQYFERIYPSTGITHIGSLDNCIDSGFIVCGSQNQGILMKIKFDGDTEWIKSDTDNLLWSNSVIQNSAGNFVVVGSGNSEFFNSQVMIKTYDPSGNILSADSVLPDDGWGTWGISIVRSSNRDYSHYWYYLDGFTASNNTIMDNGNILGNDLTAIRQNSVSMNNNGQYCAAGNLLFDLDTAGIWRDNILRLSGTCSGYFFFDTDFTSCSLTSGGGVIVAGISDSSGTSFVRMLKFDAASFPVSDKFIADSTLTFVHDIQQTADGDFALLCAGNEGGNHIVFLMVDSMGALKWKRDFYGYSSAVPVNFRILPDGFVILGTTNNDPYVIRTDSAGSTTSTSVSGANPKNSVSIYPNPSHGKLHVLVGDISYSEILLTVYDLMGRNLSVTKVEQSVQQIDLSFLAKGVYLYKIQMDGGNLKSGKLILD